MSQQELILRKQTLPFTQVPNSLLCNPDLSAIAKSLWCVLYSKPDNWVFFWKEIERHFKEGRDSMRKALKELENKGFVQKEQRREETGRGNEKRFGGMIIAIFFEPQTQKISIEEQPKPTLKIIDNKVNNKNQIKSNKKISQSKNINFSKKNDDDKKIEIKKLWQEKGFRSDNEQFFYHYSARNWKNIYKFEPAAFSWEKKYCQDNNLIMSVDKDQAKNKAKSKNIEKKKMVIDDNNKQWKTIKNNIKESFQKDFYRKNLDKIKFIKLKDRKLQLMVVTQNDSCKRMRDWIGKDCLPKIIQLLDIQEIILHAHDVKNNMQYPALVTNGKNFSYRL